MMDAKFLVFLVLVGACAAYWGGDKRISIDESGSYIDITTPDGKRIHIVKDRRGPDGRKTIDIEVSGPYMRPKFVRINDESEGFGGSSSEETEYGRIKRSSRREGKRSQGDLLFEICNEYRGLNDEKSYKKFLEKLEKHIRKGEVDPTVLECIRELDLERELDSDLLDTRRQDILSFLQPRDRFQTIDRPYLKDTLFGERRGFLGRGVGREDLLQDDLERQRILREREIERRLLEDIPDLRGVRLGLSGDDVVRRALLERELDENKRIGRVPLTRGQYIRGSILRRPESWRGVFDPRECQCLCEGVECLRRVCLPEDECCQYCRLQELRDSTVRGSDYDYLRNRLFAGRQSPLIRDRVLGRGATLDQSRVGLYDQDFWRQILTRPYQAQILRPYGLRGDVSDDLILRRPDQYLRERQVYDPRLQYGQVRQESYPLTWREIGLGVQPFDRQRFYYGSGPASFY